MDNHFYITLAILFFIHLAYYIKSKRKKHFITSILILIGFTVFYFVRRDFFNYKHSIVIAMTVWSIFNIVVDIFENKKEKQYNKGKI